MASILVAFLSREQIWEEIRQIIAAHRTPIAIEYAQRAGEVVEDERLPLNERLVMAQAYLNLAYNHGKCTPPVS